MSVRISTLALAAAVLLAGCAKALPPEHEEASICIGVCERTADCLQSGAVCRDGLCLLASGMQELDARVEDTSTPIESDARVEMDAGLQPDADAIAPVDGGDGGDGGGDAGCGSPWRLQTDPAHCGACDIVCEEGESCMKGACIRVLATLPADHSAIMDLQLRNGQPYWFDFGHEDDEEGVYLHDGGFYTLAGDEVVTLAYPLDRPTNMELDSTHAYFSLDNQEGLATIVKMPLAGGSMVTLADQFQASLDLAMDGDRLYWFAWNGGTAPYTLMRVSTDGTAPKEVLPLAREPAFTPGTLAFDATRIYWVEWLSIYSAAKDGSDPRPVVDGTTSDPYPEMLAVDDTHAYYTWRGTGANAQIGLSRVPKGGGEPTELAHVDPYYEDDNPLAIAGDSVFWAYQRRDDANNGQRNFVLIEFDRTSGEATHQLIGPGEGVLRMAVDQDAIYFLVRKTSSTPSDPRDVVLMRVRRPLPEVFAWSSTD